MKLLAINVLLAVAWAALWNGFSLPNLLAGFVIGFSALWFARDLIAQPDERVAWGGSLLVLWGIGATIGPMLGGAAMDALGPGALFAFTALGSFTLFVFLVWRLYAQRRKRKPGQPLGVPFDTPP